MKTHLFLIIVLFFTSCTASQSQLSENKTFQSVFTNSEIRDLQLLFDFFNESICLERQNKPLNSCYEDFLQNISMDEQSGNIKLNIPLEDQKATYNQISDATFNEIWRSGNRNYLHPTDSLKSVSLNTNGKYFRFLEEAGKDDKKIKQYFEQVRDTGTIPPSLIADLLMRYDDYNTDDIRVQFIVAIHFLTLND